MLKFIGNALKTFLVLILLALLGAFYAGTRWNASDDNAPENSPAAENTETEESPPVAAPEKLNLSASSRAEAVLFELRVRKKTAERRLKETESKISRLETQNADIEQIREVREVAESFKRELKNCDDAIAVAQAELKRIRADEARSRENEPRKILEKIQ